METDPDPAPSGLASYDSPAVNVLAPPLVGAAAVLATVSPLGFLLEGFHVWIHECGHVTIAWLTGRMAIPFPIGWTNVQPARSTLFVSVLLLAYAAMITFGWRERRLWTVFLGAALVAAQVGMTFFLGDDRARMWMIFGGVGGEFYLSAAMVALFYMDFSEGFRWCRYPILFIGASSFFLSYALWWKIRRGLEGIPYGSMIEGEDSGRGDMNILHDEYGWTQHQIIGTYWHLANACLVAVVVIYLFYSLRLNRIFYPFLGRLLSVESQ